MPSLARRSFSASTRSRPSSIDPEPNERNDNLHLVSVKASRNGVNVYTRPDIVIPKPANAGVRRESQP